MDYIKRSQEIKSEIIENRRAIHMQPEVGMDLPITTAFVVSKLIEYGYTPQVLSGGGVCALVGNGEKVFLLRADMDALPMQEDSGIPFASQNENAAHTCGHDMHTAMLLGAAKLLKENEASLSGQVKLMFQPGEEVILGAKSMIADGILENPKVDAAFAIHMMPLIKAGVLAYAIGETAASNDSFTITVTGKGGHGAKPHETIDPINAAAHIHLSLQEIISREIDPTATAVLTIGSFNAGSTGNIIPAEAVMKGTLRTYSKDLREHILSRINDIITHTATAFRTTAALEITAAIPPLTSDKDVVETIDKAFKNTFGGYAVLTQNAKMTASEDFAEIADLVPSMFIMLGGGDEESGYQYGLHHPKIRYDEETLPIGAAAYAQAATAWLDAQK